MTEGGTDRDHDGDGSGQVHAHADGERRQGVLGVAAQDLIDGDDDGANEGAQPQQAPVEVPAEDALDQVLDEVRLGRGQSVVTGVGCSGEAEGALHEAEHRRDDDGAEDDTDDERHLLLPRGGVDELAGLEVLEVVVRDGGHAEDDRGDEQGVGHQGADVVGRGGRGDGANQRGRGDRHEDADAGDRRVGGADEAGHVAAHRGDDQSGQQDEEDGDDDEARGVVSHGGPVQEQPQEHTDGQHGADGDADDRLHRQVALGQGDLLTGVALGAGGQGLADAGDDGTEDLQEGPDGGDGDGAGADNPHLTGEGGAHEVGEVLVGHCRAPGAHREQHPVGDEQADDHGDADADADQVAHAGQRQGQGGAHHRGAGTDPEDPGDVDADGLEGVEEVQGRRGDGAPHDDTQSTAGLLGPFAGVAHAQDLGAGHALRVGQVGVGHERAPQRDGVGDAEDAAQDDDQDGLEVGESGPPAHDDESGQHEDDGGQRPGRRGDRLDDVVLLDRVIGEAAQDRHGDDGGRDRGGEGESHLEAEVDVRRGEDERDDAADDDAAGSQLLDRAGAGTGRLRRSGAA